MRETAETLPDGTNLIHLKEGFILHKSEFNTTSGYSHKRKSFYGYGNYSEQWDGDTGNSCSGCGKEIKLGKRSILIGGGSVVCKSFCVPKMKGSV